MLHYRALFISDVHLGTHWTQAARLCEFLSSVEADTIYLVGDIIDFWRVRRGLVWNDDHSRVLRLLLDRSRAGTRIVFLPGNHEDGLKRYCGTRFGSIEIERSAIHVISSGARYLVTHGDDFDVVARRAKWLAVIGDRSYAAALAFNGVFNRARRAMGLDYWSISAFLKHQVKKYVGRMGNFESSLVAEARRHSASGVICGHIHHAADQMIDGIHYINLGDWVESCTALVETETGRLELMHWGDGRAVTSPALPAPARRNLGAPA
jgi:UDP-2,3-diacylglucosamine pyrophosphatase LpxH